MKQRERQYSKDMDIIKKEKEEPKRKREIDY